MRGVGGDFEVRDGVFGGRAKVVRRSFEAVVRSELEAVRGGGSQQRALGPPVVRPAVAQSAVPRADDDAAFAEETPSFVSASELRRDVRAVELRLGDGGRRVGSARVRAAVPLERELRRPRRFRRPSRVTARLERPRRVALGAACGGEVVGGGADDPEGSVAAAFARVRGDAVVLAHERREGGVRARVLLAAALELARARVRGRAAGRAGERRRFFFPRGGRRLRPRGGGGIRLGRDETPACERRRREGRDGSRGGGARRRVAVRSRRRRDRERGRVGRRGRARGRDRRAHRAPRGATAPSRCEDANDEIRR